MHETNRVNDMGHQIGPMYMGNQIKDLKKTNKIDAVMVVLKI